jgi:hypothetical protein
MPRIIRAGRHALMLVVQLSDHPADLLREVRQRQAAAEHGPRAAYEDVIAVHRDRIADAQAARDRARAQHRWLAWLRGVFTVRRLHRQAPPAWPEQGPQSDEEARLTAGIEGERRVQASLSLLLDDDWTLLRGYRNRRGEIDHLLVGPPGLFAIEGKHRNATVDCSGDRWWATKYDKYGNLVGSRAEMTDQRGRSPSEQVNEPAAELEDFLRRRGHPVPIARIVTLTHPRARLGNCVSPTVHITTSASELAEVLNRPGTQLTPAERAELRRLIIRDHHFHDKRRPGQRR